MLKHSVVKLHAEKTRKKEKTNHDYVHHHLCTPDHTRSRSNVLGLRKPRWHEKLRVAKAGNARVSIRWDEIVWCPHTGSASHLRVKLDDVGCTKTLGSELSQAFVFVLHVQATGTLWEASNHPSSVTSSVKPGNTSFGYVWCDSVAPLEDGEHEGK